MKKYLYILVFVFLASVSYSAQMIRICYTPSGTSPSFLVNQNFEGTGYDNSESWTENGSPDEDYNSTVLRGSQSLGIATNGDYAQSPGVDNSGTTDFFFRFQTDVIAVSDIIRITNTSDSTIGRITLLGDGDLRIYHGTVNSETSDTPVSVDTTIYIWVDFTPGSGSDGVMHLYHSASITKPGSPDITITTGDVTANLDHIRCIKATATSLTFIFDQVLIDDETIGNVDA